MELIELSLNDKQLIKDMFVRVFASPPWNDDWSDEKQLDAYITDLIGNHNSLVLGYFEDGVLTALSMGWIKHWYKGTEYYIDEFCVLTEKQGTGIGTRFMKGLEKYLLSKGIVQIFLQTGADMPAYSFYLKRGFTELKGHVSFAKDLRQ